MLTPAINTKLHLDSLLVSGFRGIANLAIPRLGRVTLLAGKNGVGKTSALNAVQIYAARSSYGVLATLLRNHGELHRTTNAEGVETLAPDWNGLFHGRDMRAEPGIVIGQSGMNPHLTIKAALAEGVQMSMLSSSRFHEGDLTVLRVDFGNQRREIPIAYPLANLPNRSFQAWPSELIPEIKCESIGPGLPGNLALARFWDEVLLRDSQDLAIEALALVLDTGVEWIAVIGDSAQRGADRGRRVIVKIKGQDSPVPLQSLGDGAARLFGVALALANSRDGFLLIDEAENGIHHSIQQDFWNLVLLTAQQYNVQVLATTHSWDCVVGFAKAMQDFSDADGVYIRLEKDNDGMRAVEYPNESLIAAAQYGIETR